MNSATLRIRFFSKRLLDQTEAAEHCGGLSLKRFLAECPVQPVRFSKGELFYDIHDLDAWIDGLKAGLADHDADAIIKRLGQ
jgi:hypothetical protein